ncbi:liprin-beta-2 isoform X9 [Cygnus olor]|nr:liprin-beta-2 isoform X9 [Cygnus olor]XP_040415825.1 liprin-beta-2 isoform X9 [Cygnus olor]XP_040415827.1 liprin-beta-2 isoform X9 [Cygnus olor]XP_040415828.1 liprin-beta-2 isoform X9 [Cygnus olor]XP_040415829.1 liprin-beta-2 isoform X9 [Cygnus olor]XP_040415830.1 liprin-beta-2 isoform X9 [Cygnus olor]XP_040415831.1 liprin-beta-2 isoform X9 [Cygnus olor]
MASDASHMLEAALEQMDDIIAGTKSAAEYANGAYDIVSPAPSVYLGTFQILHLLEDLKMALEMLEDPQEKEALRNQIPGATAVCIREWFEENLSQVNHHSSTNNETYQERLARLEGDKESLILQVSVLTDQVEAQGEKIRDLEICLEGHQLKLNATEEMLQQELLSRTSLETQKLDLMAEVSDLKIKLVGMEKEQSEYEEKQNKAEGLLQELRHLKIKVEELENERNQYEWKLKATKAEIAQLQEQLALKDAEIERLQSQLSRTSSHSEVAEREEVYRRRLKEKHQEVQRLKIGMESLLAANEEKDRRIEELTLLLSQYRRVKEIMIAAHGKMSCSSDRIVSGGNEEELEATLRKWNLLNNPQGDLFKSEASSGELPPATLSPVPHKATEISGTIPVSSTNLTSPQEETLEILNRVPQKKKSSSLEDLQSESLEKYVDGKPVQPVVEQETKPLVKGSKYQTLPGKLPRPSQNGDQGTYNTSNSPDTCGMNDSEDNSILGLNRIRSVSAPVLGETENVDGTVVSDDLSPLSSGTDSGPQSPLSPENRKSPKGIKKIWGKIRRTQSGNFPADDLGLAEFRRGGLRATAGPRLSRSKETKGQKSDYNAPFAQWSTERVCNWLEDFGLGQYVIFARQWVTSGHTLLTATPQDMEKEMGIKHPLHRKKLVLAIKSINAKQDEKSAQLDHIWVTRWLDDIGLPQYKDQFHESRVDGRMLQYLTVNDLLFLKVTSQLHHLSIKCAIHVLHVNSFNPHCLRRRPVEENNVSPSEVVQWSNHRVMEWLRSVDLAEYAPNLRGSGVHGGLIILEPRFNGDTLAMLLNIPPQKTLLRRHLTTNFNVLIGPEAQQEKRDITESTAYTPLTTTAKVRPKKLGFSHFGNLRKKKFDESTDYICPMDTNPGATNGTQKNYGGYKGLSPFTDRELDQMEHSEGTVKQIGAFSQGISNLTTMLSQDEMLNDSRFLTPTFEDWR